MDACHARRTAKGIQRQQARRGEWFSPTRFSLTGAGSSLGVLPGRVVRPAAKRKTLFVIMLDVGGRGGADPTGGQSDAGLAKPRRGVPLNPQEPTPDSLQNHSVGP